MKYLITFNDNYHDEFSVCGFTIMDSNMLSLFDDMSEKVNDYIEKGYTFYCYFGTNQSLEYDEISTFNDCFDISEITDTQAELFDYFFGKTYGFFPMTAMADWLCDIEKGED